MHRLNMELDLEVYLGSMCTDVLIGCDPTTLPPPSRIILGSYTRALLVSYDRRHLFVTPCLHMLVLGCYLRNYLT
jgi:hypothetical protein